MTASANSYRSLDDALDILSAYGPDRSDGLTSHAPMAVEALCAMDRPDAVMPWLAAYQHNLLPRPAALQPIAPQHWREALAHRFGDWRALFGAELAESPWPEVVDRWLARLAPGICASATHGVIRTAHAARSLSECASTQRFRELADGLAYWAANYQELPANPHGGAPMRAADAITYVAVVPPDRRRFSGTITSSLEALSEFPEFAPVIGWLDVGGNPADLISDLTDTFTRVYLANAHDVLTAIVFIHGVTSIAALGNLIPLLRETTVRTALRFAWQASCALYAAFGTRPASNAAAEPPREDADTLIGLAVAHGDEHVIKFTEACLHAHVRRPSPAYLAGVRHALAVLPPVRS